jgi:D-serine deaminase-like pyridoxal phosphate-dependent protein
MQLSPIGLPIDALDTPALLLDLDALEHNIGVMAGHIAARGKQWRPHAKAFKTPAIAHKLMSAGALGLTVAKVSEAEVFAASGIDDILIAHMVVGPSKAARLAALQRSADVKATVDHADHLGPLAEAARAACVTIGLLVDVDIGLGRAGVRRVEDAVALARRVAGTPGLRFDGLMGYEGHALTIDDPIEKRRAVSVAIERLGEAVRAVESAGLPCPIVSAAGSGSYQITADLPHVTELQAGGGIFGCMYYLEVCRVAGHRTALGVLASVVSRPTRDLAILDAGRKAMSDYRITPVLPRFPGCPVLNLSAEHATIRLVPEVDLRIGEKIVVTPGYSDLTFVLHDRVLGTRGGVVEAAWPLWGRGMLQ